MSYCTWITYGFGICVDDIYKDKSLTVDKFLNLAAMEPSVLKIAQDYIDEICQRDEISKEDLTIDDFDDLEGEYGEHGLALILNNIITDIPVVWANDYDGAQYLLYTPSYPWTMDENEVNLTKDKVEEVFTKYVKMITDIPVKVTYYDVENGG